MSKDLTKQKLLIMAEKRSLMGGVGGRGTDARASR